jgi:hypothetical protein
MTGFVPATRDLRRGCETWMRGTSPRMTVMEEKRNLLEESGRL